MIRNLKALGLAFVAILALGAVAASAASAQEQGVFTTAKGAPVELTAEETGEGQNFLKAFGIKVECPGSHYFGEIENGETTASLAPEYKQEACKSANTFPTRIDPNGCTFTGHLGNTTPAGNKEGTYGATFDVVCGEGEDITVTVFTNAADLAANSTMCVLHVKPQTGLTGAHVTDTGGGDIDVTGTVTGIHVVRTEGFTPHPILCPAGTTNTGEFSIDATGSNAGLSISEE